jgi:hypothetical protein
VPGEEKRIFPVEIFRRATPLDSGPLEDTGAVTELVLKSIRVSLLA